ncbi:MAG: site-specific DNA-methyltransferase [Deltaproteobacteria bacterium]|nr:site-specific DNA-methyltransferase [Deltaproteobacteria bacterium]
MAVLNFKGKTFVQNHHLAVKYHQLIPKKDKSLTGKVSLNDNLIIHGDNLKALKALLPTYAGKVKCIYIDPPYNTGNEKWVYNDKVNSPMIREWLGKVVDREDLTRHEKWLCMMMPRLKLLRELLAEDGIIFINIDDNEVHHLRILMDEIFGEDNFLASISWEKRFTRSNNARLFSSIKDYIVTYRKSSIVSQLREARSEKSNSIYTNPDNDPRGLWTSVSYVNPATKAQRPNLTYKIKNPFSKEMIEHPTNAWKYSYEVYLEHAKENSLYWGEKGGNTFPRLKKFLTEVEGGIVPTDLWRYDDSGTTDEGSKELNEILGKDIFENPKPTKLIKRTLNLALDDSPNAIVLDSFAGSGTTAHAVLDLNKEDGGNRKFVLVECEDYADEITAERVRRVIKGVKKAADEKLKDGLGGTFSFFELGDAIEMESILEGKQLPSYIDLARYVFYTATGEEFDPKKVNEKKSFIGESKEYEVYLFYRVLGSKQGYKGVLRNIFNSSKYMLSHLRLKRNSVSFRCR